MSVAFAAVGMASTDSTVVHAGPFELPGNGKGTIRTTQRRLIKSATGVSVSVRQRKKDEVRKYRGSGPARHMDEALAMARGFILQSQAGDAEEAEGDDDDDDDDSADDDDFEPPPDPPKPPPAHPKQKPRTAAAAPTTAAAAAAARASEESTADGKGAAVAAAAWFSTVAAAAACFSTGAADAPVAISVVHATTSHKFMGDAADESLARHAAGGQSSPLAHASGIATAAATRTAKNE